MTMTCYCWCRQPEDVKFTVTDLTYPKTTVTDWSNTAAATEKHPLGSDAAKTNMELIVGATKRKPTVTNDDSVVTEDFFMERINRLICLCNNS